MKNELKKFKKLLSQNYSECFDSQHEDEEAGHGEEEEQKRSSRKAFVKITLQFLRRMKQENLADSLQKSKRLLIDVAGKINKYNKINNDLS